MEFNKKIKSFINYVGKFDQEKEKILEKRIHTLKVVNISETLAQKLGLNEEDIMVAKLIGLLHDIGRFEQIKKYDSFEDIEMDHADYGVELLFEKKLIRDFIETNKYDNIIYSAIKYHNKLSIPKNLDERTKLFCKLIRDADKIDIYRVITESDNNNVIDEISKEVLEEFYKNISINYSLVKNESDSIILSMAYMYDINFKGSYDYIKENNVFDNFIKSIKVSDNNKELFNDLVKKINNFIKNNKKTGNIGGK